MQAIWLVFAWWPEEWLEEHDLLVNIKKRVQRTFCHADITCKVDTVQLFGCGIRSQINVIDLMICVCGCACISEILEVVYVWMHMCKDEIEMALLYTSDIISMYQRCCVFWLKAKSLQSPILHNFWLHFKWCDTLLYKKLFSPSVKFVNSVAKLCLWNVHPFIG